MSLCREWSLVKHLPEQRYCKPLYCRSWGCEECGPMRRRRLMAMAAGGEPTRFCTLTVNPSEGESPEQRLAALSNAWRLVVKRLRRLHPSEPVEYLAIVEQTKAGEPHLHILLRSPFVPQAWLSAAMSELINAPIVDIRLIRHAAEVIRYVAKYVTKAPAKMGSAKRYWSSQGYNIPETPTGSTDPSIGPGWTIDKRPLHFIIEEWLYDSYQARHHRGDVLVGFRVDHWLTSERLL